jgi:hypothetical protein
MKLTGKDLAATLFTGLVVAVYVAFLQGATLPVITSVRGTAAAVLAIGWLGGCALSGTADLYASAQKSSVAATVGLTMMGVVALLAAVVALATASQAALAVLVAATVMLWVAATLRHLFRPPASTAGESGQRDAADRTSTMV